MNVAELRRRLEELERDGYGSRGVEVSPAPPPVRDWPVMSREEERKYRLNFVVMNYLVDSVSLSPLITGAPVTLNFVEAAEVPDDLDLEETELFVAR